MLQSYISTTVPAYSSNLDALIAGVQIVPGSGEPTVDGDESDSQQSINKIEGTDLLNTLE